MLFVNINRTVLRRSTTVPVQITGIVSRQDPIATLDHTNTSKEVTEFGSVTTILHGVCSKEQGVATASAASGAGVNIVTIRVLRTGIPNKPFDCSVSEKASVQIG